MMKSIAVAAIAAIALEQAAIALPSSPIDYRSSFVTTHTPENVETSVTTMETEPSQRAEIMAAEPVRYNRCALRSKRVTC